MEKAYTIMVIMQIGRFIEKNEKGKRKYWKRKAYTSGWDWQDSRSFTRDERE